MRLLKNLTNLLRKPRTGGISLDDVSDTKMVRLHTKKLQKSDISGTRGASVNQSGLEGRIRNPLISKLEPITHQDVTPAHGAQTMPGETHHGRSTDLVRVPNKRAHSLEKAHPRSATSLFDLIGFQRKKHEHTPTMAPGMVFPQLQQFILATALTASVLGLFFLIRLQFVVESPQTVAFPSALVRPNRQLSFQGRLTDIAGNPVTGSANMAFRLYDVGPGTGGTLLWNSTACTVTPDQDGIFSTGLGDDCGDEITNDVFSENSSVWLEVEVESETLSPRQHIKAVAYALNSETLQGYPATASAVENTVVVMNNSGQIVLGNAAPVITATSPSGLTLSAQTLTFTTSSDGNIVLDPDGLGTVFVQSNLGVNGSATVSGNLNTIGDIESGGNLIVGADAQIGGYATVSSSLAIGYNTAPAGTGNAIFSGFVGIGTSSPSQALHVLGNSMFDGTLRLTGALYDTSNSAGSNGYVLTSTGTGTAWINMISSVGGSNLWDQTGSALHPKNYPWLDLVVGGNSTASAKFQAEATTGNVTATGTFTGTRFISTVASGTSPLAVNSPTLVMNLNADLLDGFNYDQLPYVEDTTNATLVRNGAGPYTLELNLANANTWTAIQTFSVDTIFQGNGIWEATGNVGIGTITPQYALDVVGNVAISGLSPNMPVKTNANRMLVSGAINIASGSAEINGTLPVSNGGTGATTLTGVLKGNGTSPITAMTGTANRVTYWTDANTIGADDDFFFDGTSVGIGTIVPTQTLDITGDLRVRGNDITDSADAVRISLGATTTLSNTITTLLGTTTLTASSLSTLTTSSTVDWGGITTLNFTADNLVLNGSDAANGDLTLRGTNNGTKTSSYVLLQDTGGNVGIGTTLPYSTLEVNGDIRATSFGIRATSDLSGQPLSSIQASSFGAGTSGSMNFMVKSSGTLVERMRLDTNGNLGIGTTDPSVALDIVGSASLSGALAFRGTTDPKINILNGEDFGVRTSVGGDAGLTERLTILNSGFVGIGTTIPTQTLHIAGDMRLTGAYYDRLNSAGSTGQVLSSTATGSEWINPDTLSVGDASTLDTLDSTDFLRSNVSDSYTGTGTLDFASGTTLDINGNLSIADTDITLDGTTTNFTSTGNVSFNTSQFFLNQSTGNIGIGTTTADNVLTMLRNANTGVYSILRNPNTGTEAVTGWATESNTASGGVFAMGSNYTGGGLLGHLADRIVLSNSVGAGISLLSAESDADIRFYTGGALAANQRMIIESGGNVGIGTTDALYLLDVRGDASASGTLGIAGSLSIRGDVGASGDYLRSRGVGLPPEWVDMSSSLLPLGSTGQTLHYDGAAWAATSSLYNDNTNVGIGTTNVTAARLVVNGGINVSGAATIGTLAAGATDTVVTHSSGVLQARTIDSRVWSGNFVDGSGTTNYLSRWTDSDTLGIGVVYDNATNVGIGTTTVSNFKLTVAGAVGPSANDTYDLGSDSLRWRDLFLGGETLHIGASTANEGQISYDATGNIFNFGTDGTGNGDIAFFTNDLYMDKSTGNIGMGTTVPAATLHGYGDVGVNATLLFGNTANAGLAYSSFTNDLYIGGDNTQDGNLYIKNVGGSATVSLNSAGISYLTGGNVGIGTTAPLSLLQVTNATAFDTGFTAAGQDNLYLRNTTAVGSGVFGASIGFARNDDNTLRRAAIAAVQQISGNQNQVGLSFFTHPSGNNNDPIVEGMRIDAYGNVGIGTDNPGSKLDLNGSLRITNGTSNGINGSTDNIKFHTARAPDDNSYEWLGFYSGTIRQGIILYDGQWTGCNNSLHEFCIAAETNNFLTLKSPTTMGTLLTGGNVGIGTTATPSAKLLVEHTNTSTSANTSNYPLKLNNNAWVGNQITGIEFWNGSSNKAVPTARIISQMNGGGNGGENLHFQTQPYSATNPNPNQPTTKMTINFDGNVGIDTTTPTSKLHIGRVNGEATLLIGSTANAGIAYTSADGNLIVGGDNSQSGNVFVKNVGGTSTVSLNSAGTSYFTGGNLGVLTSTANAAITVGGASNIRVGDYVSLGRAPSNAATVLGNNVEANPLINNGMRIINTHASYAGSAIYVVGGDGIVFHTAVPAAVTAGDTFSSPRMKITTAGNVSIGTTTALAMLHVGTTTGSFLVGSTADRGLAYDNGSGDLIIGGSNAQAGNIQMYNSTGVNTVNINSDATSTFGALTSSANIGASRFYTGNGTAALPSYSFTGDPNSGLYLSAGSNVGIAVNGGVGAYVLDVGGTKFLGTSGALSSATLLVSGAQVEPSGLAAGAGTRTVCANSAASNRLTIQSGVCGTSSIIYKENVRDTNYGLYEVMQMRPVVFKYKGGPIAGRMDDRVGLIAEEVHQLMPEVIQYRADGGIDGIDYDNLIAVLINAVQEQQGQILNTTALAQTNNIILSNPTAVVIGDATTNYAVVPSSTQPALTKALGAAQGFIGKLYAGLVKTRDLVVSGTGQIASLSVNSMTVAGQSLQSYIEGVVNNMQLAGTTSLPEGTVVEELTVQDLATDRLTSDELTAGTATIAGSLVADTITTDTLSAQTTSLGKLLSTEVAVLGDATVSGSLTVAGDFTASGSSRLALLEGKLAQFENIRSQTATLYDATVSGTLYAETIANLDGLIANSVQPTFLQQLLGYDPASTNSAQLLSQITGVNLSETVVLDPSGLDSLPVDATLLGAHAGFFSQYLQVNGSFAVGGDTLMVGKTTWASGLALENNSLSYIPQALNECNPEYVDPAWSQLSPEELETVLEAHQTMCREHITLKIQPSGSGVLNLMDGLLVAENGAITIDGAVTFKKPVTIESTLLTDLVRPTDFDRPFQLQVAGIATESGEVKKSRFELIDEMGTPVATISAEGVAQFTGEVTAKSLGLTGQEDLTDETGAEVETGAKTGKAVIAAGSSQITIKASKTTQDSLIFVTAQGSTGNQALYVKSQAGNNPETPENEARFVAGFDNPIGDDVTFTWWIVN